jgi:hypothetical protein
LKLINKLFALFGSKDDPAKKYYFEPDSTPPIKILRDLVESCDNHEQRAENAAKYAEMEAARARLAAASYRKLAAEYRTAADALDHATGKDTVPSGCSQPYYPG